ncbi:DUF2330 domain-containing protein [bacterium]|nr:DUF2330 domain-containing protein [bacterium]MBU1072765.1 DUF2330 domain-containing protein [bacterium]MBU1675586.1 DUF2330 domain-containing protein [bacterium]
MTRSTTLTAGILLTVVLAAATSLADGCMIAPWEYEIYETEQVAYLAYDADAGIEDLHILPKFYGDTQNFAWIVPVPGLPELEESDVDIFRQLAMLSAPEQRYRDEGWGCDRADYVVSPANDGEGGVDIIDEQLVGIYRTMTVGADDADALTDSLTAWGFLHAGNLDDVAPMLASYVDDAWYFVTLKVDSTAFEEAQYDWFWYGAMQPIRLIFPVDAPVYPMRISALSADDDTSVTLYVNADRRMDFVGAETHYANALSAGEMRAIGASYPDLAARLAAGDYLTKLRRNYTPAQMDADIYLEPASTNTEFRRIYYSGLPLTSGLLLALAGALFFRARRRRGAPAPG